MFRLRSVSMVLLGTVVASASATEIYALMGGNLGKFDSDNPAVVTMVGDTPAYNVDFTSEGVLYGVDNTQVFRINPADASSVLLGDAGLVGGDVFTDISWDPVTERMYGICGTTSSAPTNLYEINLTTGAATFIAALNVQKPSVNMALATAANGVRYMDDGVRNGLYRVDGLDGTFLGPEGVTVGIFTGLAIDWNRTGTCYHGMYNMDTARNEFWTVDLNTGVGTFVGVFAPDLPNSLITSFAINPVPEPATLTFVLAVALLRRR